jgi:putative SOS response-associated peptidase YedK
MCGRYTQTAAFEELALRFGITVEEVTDEDLASRYNVAPSQPVPIVVGEKDGRRLVMARWGFHPGWMRSTKLAPINAKAETIATSGMFQSAVERGRCLVPASGFYEWQPVPGQKRKRPFYVRLKGGALFGFAGLWAPADPRTGAPATCAIITTTANDLLAPIHDRMPAILAPEDEARWLDPSVTNPARVLSCLRPLGTDRMEAYPVSSLVSSPDNEGAQLVEPVTA